VDRIQAERKGRPRLFAGALEGGGLVRPETGQGHPGQDQQGHDKEEYQSKGGGGLTGQSRGEVLLDHDAADQGSGTGGGGVSLGIRWIPGPIDDPGGL
jgi:hypothetical protein